MEKADIHNQTGDESHTADATIGTDRTHVSTQAEQAGMPTIRRLRLGHVDSTNNFLRQNPPEAQARVTIVTAEYQTAGRGSASNKWESAEGLNIVMSLLVHPTHIPPTQQYQLTEVLALAVREALDTYQQGFVIKWPNDIYYGHKKVVGMLIENRLTSTSIRDCIMGVGINVNQTRFVSDAPNPSSLALITGREVDREELLSRIMDRFLTYYSWTETNRQADIHELYLQHLYKRDITAQYEDKDGRFDARIDTVEPDGHLVMTDSDGRVRRYEFKEVKFCLPNQ